MKTKRTLKSMLSALCCIAMLLSLVPVLPAAAATTALTETFEAYSADSEFASSEFKASHTLNGGSAKNTVVQGTDGKYLQMTAQNSNESTGVARNRIHTAATYSGNYTVEFDFMRASDTQSVLDVYLRHGGYIRARVTKDGGVQLWVHGNAASGKMKTMTMSGVTLAKNTWYSFKAQVSDSGIRLSVYAKGQAAALGTLEMVQDTNTDPDLLMKYNVWFDLNGASSTGDTAPITVGLDNVKVTTGTEVVKVAGDTSGTVIVDGNYVAGGSQQWTFFSEDFSSFKKGDSVLGNGKFSTIYSSGGYNVAEENGNKYVQLTAPHSKSERAQLTLESKVSGAYTLEFDYMPTSEVKGANFLDAAVQSTTVRVRLDCTSAGRNYIQCAGDGLTNSSNLSYEFTPYTWYSVKIVVDAGSVTAKVWPKGEKEPVNGMVVSGESLPVSTANKPNITLGPTYNAAVEQPEYTIGIDNIRMYKGTDFTLPAVSAGAPGSALELALDYTGQNLSAESPAPQFKWELNNDQLGHINARGKLILGPGVGETELKVTLLDADGNPTDLSGTTKLVVGTSNGVTASPAELKLAESDMGSTRQLSVQVDSAVAAAVPNYKLAWSSTNEAVAKVDANGLVSLVGVGSAKVQVAVLTADGEATSYFALIPVQVGENPLRILSIGNSHSRDSFYYLSYLGAAADKRVEAAYLHKDSGLIRHHAHNLVTEAAEYSYYKANPVTGEPVSMGKETIQTALADGEWDIIMLHQGTAYAGAPGTFNSDIPYIIDYIKDEQPNAKIYWMLGWAYSDDFDEERPSYSHAKNFATYYNGSQHVMYNAFIDCFEQFIWGENAKYGDLIDGWFPTGQAIQNLRATYGDTLDRDGLHLSLTNGRLTASMAILKTLFPDLDLKEITVDEVAKFLVTDHMEAGKFIEGDPDYVNNEANLQLIRDAVNAATADLSKAPKKLPVPSVVKVEDKGTENDLTIGQGTAPIKYFFPDAKTMADGTIYVTAYKSIYHKPSGTAGADMDNMYEGYGTLTGWYSKDNGESWSDEFVLVDEDKILDWAAKAKTRGDTKTWPAEVETLSGRYELLAQNPNASYFVIADPRDPNLAVVNVDGKDLLVMTFWVAFYREDVSRVNICYMMWAEQKDGKLGEWSEPIRLTKHNGGDFVKRGDIAVFPNGRILVPFYGNSYGGVEMQWDSAKQTFVTTVTRDMKGVFSTEESTTLNEISFVAPPNSTGTVFAFVRESGEVLKSYDYGETWEFFGNQDGLIHQPGFQVVDEDRVFMTWAIVSGPRDIYGKMIYVNGAFGDTDYQAVYLTPNRKGHDMGDPSSTLMANGKLLAVCYDTEFRSIVGTVVDPNSPVNTPVELNTAVPSGTLFEQDYAGKKLDSKGITVDKAVSGSYTVEASFKLGASGKVNVGGLTVTADKITVGDKSTAVTLAADTQTFLRISMVGSSAYIKVWQGEEPAGWTMGAADVITGKVTVTGSDAALDTLKLSRRVLINMPESMTVSASFQMECDIMPAVDDVVWTSSDEKIATVKNGEVTVVSPGLVDITVTAGGVSKVCKLTVDEPPAQLSGKGERVVLFSDDFQSYSSGNLWEQMKAKGYNSSSTGEANNSANLTLGSEGSEQYLKMTKSAWVRVNQAITGDYTAQFDFKFGGNGTFYATLNQGKGDTYDTRAFVHIVKGSTNGTRIQYDFQGVATNYPDSPAMHGPLADEKNYATDRWYTAKFTRADKTLYVKIWEQGTDEPEAWGQSYTTDAFETELAANQGTFFRMQWADSTTMCIDNLTITQQQGKGADFMLDVPGSAWYRDAVDYAIKNGIMSGYNAISFGPNDTLSRAMVVQVLYNKEGQPAITGAHKFPDVKSGDWFNNAVTWGSQKGVVGGYGDGRFGPNDAVTIQQIAVILWNYSGNPKFTGTPDGVGTYDDWAKNGLSWAVENGILKNVPMQNATEKATRAQTAQMLMNYLSK